MRPFGGLAAAIIFFFLKLNPHKGKTIPEHVHEFDFLGLVLVVGGVICVLIGFNHSTISCASCAERVDVIL